MKYDHRLCGLIGVNEYWTTENKQLRELNSKIDIIPKDELSDQEDELLDKLRDLYDKASKSPDGCIICASTDFYEAKNKLTEEESEDIKDLLINTIKKAKIDMENN